MVEGLEDAAVNMVVANPLAVVWGALLTHHLVDNFIYLIDRGSDWHLNNNSRRLEDHMYMSGR
jgi:hypothetical protein